MIFRKDAVLMAVAGLLASAGFAMADTAALNAPVLSLDVAATAAAPAPMAAPEAPLPENGLLMQGLDRVGAGKTLEDYGINIYGWVEGGYTYSHRHHENTAPILPGPFNHEFGRGDDNHFMLNQVTLRFEKFVASDKWDVGGLIEVTYGTDAAGIHANGLGVGNETSRQLGGERESSPDDRFNPEYQFDPTQFYLDVNVPVGNGLKIRAGKFVTLMGEETIDPRGNAFYSHSYLFSAVPFTQTGIVGFYNFNDQLSMALGITRGWDQSFEDNNGCSIDVIGQVVYKVNKQWTATLNWSSGPEDNGDSSHYRTAIDPIVAWQATDKLSFALEGLYVYDGGLNGDALAGRSHAYGDVWGGAFYTKYVFNDFVTGNLRLEKYHSYADGFGALGSELSDLSSRSSEAALTRFASSVPTINVYDITLGVTVHPFPKDPIGKNLSIRPEARYSYSEDHIFIEGSRAFKDQLTFGADVIFTF